MDNYDLLALAKQARENAYVPYSKFQVGAALLSVSGNVYTGCNVENASFGASNCAERTAVFKAVSEGEREFEKIAVYASSGEMTFPCGICRQVLSEFMPNGTLIVGNEAGEMKTFAMSEILPNAFTSFEAQDES